MATLFPPIPPSGTPYSELLVREALTKLGDEWKVFHSVAWQSLRNGRQGDGEADFILLHPNHGLIVIEVKGGDEITIEDGQWFSRNRETGMREAIKNPFLQARDSKYALLNYLREVSIPTHEVPIMHGVCFTGANVDSSIGTYGPMEIVWNKDDLHDPSQMVQRLIKHWDQKASIAPRVARKIHQLLAPTITVRRRLKDDIADAERGLIELTDQQIKAFQLLRKVRKALIIGGAGTGKTLLAANRAKLFAEDGFKVLIVCYNQLLSSWLQDEFHDQDNVIACTFHSLCLKEIKKANLAVPDDLDSGWWESDAPEALVIAAQENGTNFDAIIVDEGQDFSKDWLTALAMLTPDRTDTPYYVFADSHQDLYGRNWGTPSEDWLTIPLDTNCRNTNQIAEKVGDAFGEKVETMGVDGPPVIHHEFRPTSGNTALVEQVVERLLYEEGLGHDQVTVLSDSKQLIERLRQRGVGEYSFTEYGKYGVVAETVKRFKGLESDAVVLVLTRTTDTDTQELRSLSYVGMSRAKSLLFVLSTPGTKKTLGL